MQGAQRLGAPPVILAALDQFELTDGTIITGGADINVIAFRVPGGNVLKIPAAKLTELSVGLNDRAGFVQRAATLVKALDSAKTREAARQDLIALGSAVAPTGPRRESKSTTPTAPGPGRRTVDR